MSESYIKLENISKTYKEKTVLKIKEAIIPLGEVIAILGYSGSGKSTLINILSLIDTPDEIFYDKNSKPLITINLKDEKYLVEYNKEKMKVWYEGKLVPTNEVRNRIFGYIFQDALLHPNFNLEFNIKTPLLIDNSKIEKNCFDYISKSIGLKEHINKFSNEISGGQEQRASILRGLIKKSPIIVGDELTSNVDYKRSIQILTLIKNFIKEENKSFIWVTHDVHQTAEFADKIITIRDGELNIKDNPKNEEDILQFLSQDKILRDEKSLVKLNCEKDGINLIDKLIYIFPYAFRDLFKPTKYEYLYKPTTDFLVSFASITLVLIFLLTIIKISYSTQKFLEIKLSDPRINYLKITPSKFLADNDLTMKDVSFIEKELKNKLKTIAPIYETTLYIQHVKGRGFKSVGGTAITFGANDEVINYILENKKEFVNYVGKDDNNRSHGIVIRKDILTKSLKYPADTEKLTIKMDSIIQEVPIVVTNSPLPSGKSAILRKEFYLKSYSNEDFDRKPKMAYILIYPKNIHDTTLIVKKIKDMKKYDIDSALDVDNKIKVIHDIEGLIKKFTYTSFIAILLLSVSFIILTVYRSIVKKQKEIGVFLAYGMKKFYFMAFYAIEALILWVTTTFISINIFNFVNSYINNLFVKDSKNPFGLTNLPINIEVNITSLNLSTDWFIILYGSSFIILISIFVILIFNLIKKSPIKLLKDDNV